MDAIKELIKILTPQKLRSIHDISLGKSKSDQINILYNQISNKKSVNEIELMNLIFGDNKYKQSHFSNLKRRLKNNALFLY